MTQYDVFLSHNSADKPAVEELAHRLTGEAGLQPFLDKWHLVPGQPWQEALEEALDVSRSCAVFLGPESLGTWENEEMRAALDIRAGRPDFRVIPVLLPGARLPHRGRLPRFLARLTWVDFRPGLDDADAFHRLVCGIQGVAPGPGGVAEAQAAAAVCPFRGLQVFDQEHAPFFFGREALTQHLVEQLREDRFLAVIGPSGSGKSSLVRAGLVPQIRQGGLPAGNHWPILLFKPGEDPLGALAARLIPKTVGADKWLPLHRSLLDTLQRDERGLHRVVQVMLASQPDSRRLLVVVDQFEELFTLCRRDDARSAFVANLLYASAIAGGQAVVVVTMRADFFGKCAAYPELAARLGERDVLVGPMGEEERCQAIQRPAQVVGLRYEKGLVETILSDLGNEPGTLPLLQHTLLEMWERRRGSWLTTEAYREIGGVKGAIAGRADAIYTRLTPAQQKAARRVLLRLTQPGEGTEDTRCRAALAELLPAEARSAEVKAVVQELVDARLLTAGKDERGDEIIDVAHEALIRGWPRLQRWLNEDREFLLWRQRLRAALAEWRRTGRDEGALLRGTSLAEAERWLREQPGDLNRAERSYIQAGVALRDREAEEREARRRRELEAVRRLRILSTIAGGGIGAGLGGFLGGIIGYYLEVGLLTMPLAMLLMNVGLSSALFSTFFGSGVAFGVSLGRVLGGQRGIFPVIGGTLAGALIGPLLAPITGGEAATNTVILLGSLLGAVYGGGMALSVVAGNKLAGWKSITARALMGAIVGGLVGTTYDGVVFSALVGLGIAVGIGIVDDLYATEAT
jgi:energy-coupling factor transporter ATP-binding protein EcfA2